MNVGGSHLARVEPEQPEQAPLPTRNALGGSPRLILAVRVIDHRALASFAIGLLRMSGW
jgi:hypothetical protein